MEHRRELPQRGKVQRQVQRAATVRVQELTETLMQADTETVETLRMIILGTAYPAPITAKTPHA